MITLIRDIIRALVSPESEIVISQPKWSELISTLNERGGGVKESGAFLLGYKNIVNRRIIKDFVPYDNLDPNCLNTGIVQFDGACLGPLYAECRDRGLTVLADVHTHPGSAVMSKTDMMNPMVPEIGHLAIIIPRYASSPVSMEDIGVYRYEGRKQWSNWSGENARKKVRIGW